MLKLTFKIILLYLFLKRVFTPFERYGIRFAKDANQGPTFSKGLKNKNIMELDELQKFIGIVKQKE